jgi:hypothetical protein
LRLLEVGVIVVLDQCIDFAYGKPQDARGYER